MAHEQAAQFLGKLASAGREGGTQAMVNLLLEKAGIDERWGDGETWEEFRARAGDDVRAAVAEAKRRADGARRG